MSYKKMEEEELTRAEKGMVKMRSLTNYVMGAALFIVGILILFPNDFIEKYKALYDKTAINLLGIICIIYGVFRMYRGYMKNYFRES